MITGHDMVFLSSGPVAEAVRRLLDGWHDSWQQMVVAVSGVRDDAFLPWLELRDALPRRKAEILVVRDRAMELWWDEAGYSLMEDGEGPFAVHYQRAVRPIVRVELQQDPYDHDTESSFEAYPATLVTAGAWLLTVVAPDSKSSFTTSLLSALEVALIGQAEGSELD